MPNSIRLQRRVQAAAILTVAVPAIGIAFLALREGVMESGGASPDRSFHLILGATLILLFVDFLAAARLSTGVGKAIALALGGLVCCVVGAILSEVFGPPALALLLAGAATWAIVLARTISSGPAELVL